MVAAVQNVSIISSQQTQKQPTPNWKAQDKNNDLLNLEMEVKTYSWLRIMMSQTRERVPIFVNWLDGKDSILYKH